MENIDIILKKSDSLLSIETLSETDILGDLLVQSWASRVLISVEDGGCDRDAIFHQIHDSHDEDRNCKRIVKDEQLNIGYTVHGIKPHELPVIGTYVDSSILPGFLYRVRNLQNGEWLFDGKPRRLMSIGMGYGKRLTFCSDTLNGINQHIFWSDSVSDGYAFSICVINNYGKSGQFVAYDENDRPVCTVQVLDSPPLPAVELAQNVSGRTVIKEVKTIVTCSIKFEPASHGFLNIRNDVDEVVLEGIGILMKENGAKLAVLKRIENVHVPSIGKCTLMADA